MTTTLSRVFPLVALLLACACAQKRPAPDHRDPGPSTLVVDAHAHILRAADMPVAGYLEHAVGAPRWVARLIARVLEHYQDPERARAAPRRELSNDDVRRVLPDLVRTPDPAERVDRADVELDVVLEGLLHGVDALPADDRATFRALEDEAWADTAAMRRGDGLFDVVARHVRWAHLLTCSADDLADSLCETYPEVDLFVLLMMDMWMWFDDTPPAGGVGPQFAALEKLIQRSGGRIHPFVAFDPRRNLREPGASLHLVEQALESGFLGVKLYPPMGYRPWNNATIPTTADDPRPPDADHWDTELEKLYELCAREGFPIGAHCSTPGAEARPGRGKRSDPEFWRTVLERHPGLRLNLHHAGGLEELLPGGRDNWPWKLAELMERYEGVYGDLGHAHEILDPGLRADLAAKLRELVDMHPVVRERLLFGTDWHLIVRQSRHREYLAEHVNFFEEYFPEMLDGYLGENALRYLGLHPGEPAHERLLEFYESRGITPPDRWWQE